MRKGDRGHAGEPCAEAVRIHPSGVGVGDHRQGDAVGGRLSDGTPYFGRIGELAYDADEDRVQCHLCGEWFRALGGSHVRRRHGWTLLEYRDAFQLAMQLPTCSQSVSDRLRSCALVQIERGVFGLGWQESAERRPTRVRPWRTLAAQHPELLSELHPRRNSRIDPAAIAAKSTRKLWWRCSACGHEWQATVGSRSSGHGCPGCYAERRRTQRHRTVPADRSLHALHPELMLEWDPARNTSLEPATISPASKVKAWWRCGTCGHAWTASVQNRARGHGCPKCGVTRRAATQSRVDYDRSLAAQRPDLVEELHPTDNPGLDSTQLGARSSRTLWWRCSTCGHDWRAAVANRTHGGTGCPVCGLKRRARTQSQVAPERSLAIKHPDIADELHPTRNPGIDPMRLGARSSMKLWWRCGTCGHTWRTAVSTRTEGCGCPACYRAQRRRAA